MAPPTILAHKSSFLTAQTLQLSQALAPSANWRASNAQVAEGGLPDKLVDEVLYRANHVLLQHARRVYAPQASRHVAEQIEALYLEAAEKAVRGNGEAEGGGGGGDGGEDEEGEEGRRRGDEGTRFLRVGADFASDDIIAALPSTWDLHSATQAAAHPAEANRYADLASTLTSLSAQRKEASSRLERLRRMRALLAPLTSIPPSSSAPSSFSASTSTPISAFDSIDGIDKVQPNLVTREGELEKELERMRVLLVRVAARVAQLPDAEPRSGEDITMEDLEAVERGKVKKLLDNF